MNLKQVSEWKVKMMNNIKNIKRTQDLVKYFLETEPATRNSDDLLYFKICEHLNKGCLHLPFQTVILNRSHFSLPPFESVRRARQKLQAAFPELAGSDKVEAQREVNEMIVRDYARQVTV